MHISVFGTNKRSVSEHVPIQYNWPSITSVQLVCVRVSSQGLLRQLYDNYWVLLERTGFRPKRYIVEENIRELAKRARERTAVRSHAHI